jgi:hypothetical protein
MRPTIFLGSDAHEGITKRHNTVLGISTFLNESNMEIKFTKPIGNNLPMSNRTEAADIVLQTFDIADASDVVDIAIGANINIMSDFGGQDTRLNFEIEIFVNGDVIRHRVKRDGSKHFETKKLFGISGEGMTINIGTILEKMSADSVS